MKLWFDNRFWYLVLGCLFLLGLVFIVTGFDIYNGVIIVGVVLIIAFKLFEKFIKRWQEGKEINSNLKKVYT